MTVVVHADEATALPWKNGGGRTRELLAGPDAAAWKWRISLADIDVDGPFSAFPGVSRWFAVLRGAGVWLALPDGARRVVRGGPPLNFDGAAAPGCRLIDGPTRDLNLMLRGGARGTMQRGAAGSVWAEDWPQRARFDIGTLTLHAQLPPGSLKADSESLWIGIAP